MKSKDFSTHIPKLNQNNLKNYIKEIETYPLVNFDESKYVIKDEELLCIFQGHLRFVLLVAKQYFNLNNIENLYDHLLALSRNKKYNRSTIIKNGNNGLIKAIIKYTELSLNERNDISFNSFIIWHIRNAILNHKARASGMKKNSLPQLGNKNLIIESYINKCKELLATDIQIKDETLQKYVNNLK